MAIQKITQDTLCSKSEKNKDSLEISEKSE